MTTVSNMITPVNYHLSTTLCSQCSSMAHFQCIDHCKEVFCGKCSVKHRTFVIKQMDELKEQLKLCKIDPVATHDEIDQKFFRASQQTIKHTCDTANNLIEEIQNRKEAIIKEIKHNLELRKKDREKRTNSALLTSEEAADYTHLLHNCLKQDQLVDADSMDSIKRRLDARNALGQSAFEAKSPFIEIGKFDTSKILQLRTAPRTETSLPKVRTGNTIPVTVALGKPKLFTSPLQNTFSVGKHPTAVSLNDRYLETFFCRRTPGNSLILLSSTSIDLVNRGSGVEASVRLSKVLGTEKDKILAGAWCEYAQRLILVGNHRMYFFDFQGQERAKWFMCQPIHGDITNAARFLGCIHDGSIIYAYKSGSQSYALERLSFPSSVLSKNNASEHGHTTNSLKAEHRARIDGNVAAMCVTHNRITVVYRRFQSDTHFEHNICLFDHAFGMPNRKPDALPSDVKWITAITSFGNTDEYLLCDPRGQQLLLYHAIDGVLTRRLRIGAINACCLTDGKLVLWLQKQYASSPTGKLHFITAPHLEERSNVSKSLPLLA